MFMTESGTESFPLHGNYNIQTYIKMDTYSDEVLVENVEKLEDVEDYLKETRKTGSTLTYPEIYVLIRVYLSLYLAVS